MAWKLAELFVEISARGVGAVDDAIDGVKKKLEALEAAAKKMTQAKWQPLDVQGMLAQKQQLEALAAQTSKLEVVKTAYETVHKTIDKLYKYSVAAFAGMTAALGLWVRAGLQGTTVGNMLGVQMEFLSREITAVFLPAIKLLVDGIQKLTAWLRSLSGTQQTVIMAVVAAGVAFGTLFFIIPPLIAGITSLITALMALAAAEDFATAGLASIGQVAGVVISALAALGVGTGALAIGTEKGRAALARFNDALQPLIYAFGRLYDRLSPLVVRVGNLGTALGQVGLTSFVFLLNAATNAIGGMVDALDKWLDRLEKIRQHPVGRLALIVGTAGQLPLIEKLLNESNAANGPNQGGNDHRSMFAGHIGFEGAAESYKRIAESSLRLEGINEQKLTNTKLDTANGFLGKIASGAKPNVPSGFIGP